jgi:hypothetical protein
MDTINITSVEYVRFDDAEIMRQVEAGTLTIAEAE